MANTQYNNEQNKAAEAAKQKAIKELLATESLIVLQVVEREGMFRNSATGKKELMSKTVTIGIAGGKEFPADVVLAASNKPGFKGIDVQASADAINDTGFNRALAEKIGIRVATPTEAQPTEATTFTLADAKGVGALAALRDKLSEEESLALTEKAKNLTGGKTIAGQGKGALKEKTNGHAVQVG